MELSSKHQLRRHLVLMALYTENAVSCRHIMTNDVRMWTLSAPETISGINSSETLFKFGIKKYCRFK
jgi:hypothetical protein